MKKFLAVLLLAILTTASSPKPLSWIAIGDSITYLNDHLDETGFRVTKGYMSRVVETRTNITYENKGYNGWTSGGIAKEIDGLNLKKADIYTVFLGTNDWWQGRPIGTLDDYKMNSGNKTLFGSFRVIIDRLKLLNDHAQIILITPLQRADFVYLANKKNNAYGSYKPKGGQTLAGFAQAIIDIGKYENLDVLDLYSRSGITVENCVKYKRLKDPATGTYRNYPYPDFRDVPFDPETDDYPYPPDAILTTYDGLHPSDAGNQIIADKIAEVIRN